MQQRHYLYNSCSELMQEIQHSFYPRHSLKLLVAEEPKSQCVARWFFIKGLKYICDKRSFHLHPKCISLKANIKTKTMSVFSFQQRICVAKAIIVKHATTEFWYNRLLNFHVLYGPLPLSSIILHKKHSCRLTLRTKKIVEDNSKQLY